MRKKHDSNRPASAEQSLELLFKLASAGKISSFPAEHIQWMIDNMHKVGPYFYHFMETGGLQDISLMTRVLPGHETTRSIWPDILHQSPEDWLGVMGSKGLLEVVGEVNFLASKTTRMHAKYRMFLLPPKSERELVLREFGIRDCVPATPLEVVSLLHCLRGSSKSDYPFVSIAGSVDVVATVRPEGPVYVLPRNRISPSFTRAHIDERLLRSFVGAIRT